MKYSFIIMLCSVMMQPAIAQNDSNYPNPEFSNEVYLYQTGQTTKLLRLEKGSSKMETKTKMAGMGGAENGYTLEGEASTVRFASGDGLSFIYFSETSSMPSSRQNDSIMRANNMDPAMMQGFSMMDPASMITLYKAETGKGVRKIYMMKTGGMFSMGKNKSSDKYTISVKKIRPGYWQLIVDKTLPKGEYAFSGDGNGNGEYGWEYYPLCFWYRLTAVKYALCDVPLISLQFQLFAQVAFHSSFLLFITLPAMGL